MAPIQYNRGFNEIDARQMEEWLLDKHLHHYTATLTRNGVCCLDDLALLSSEDLTNMGITSIGARRKLLCYIAQLQGETTPRGGPEAADEVEWQSRAAADRYFEEARSRMHELGDEEGVLASIHEDARLLLKFEKEDSVTNEAYIPARFSNHSMNVDLAPIRERMQQRISHYLRPTSPPDSARDIARQKALLSSPKGPKKIINYQALINQQTDTIAGMEKVYVRYQQLLSECLKAITRDIEKHSRVGEYRDAAEYRLKVQLGNLIGLRGDQEEGLDQPYLGQLGATEATLKRRRRIEQEFESLVKTIDEDGNGLLDQEEMLRAIEANAEVREKMEVMAFNLALDPECRFVTDDYKLNIEIQEEVEEIVRELDTNKDGFIDKNEMRGMNLHVRQKLNKLGMPAILGRLSVTEYS